MLAFLVRRLALVMVILVCVSVVVFAVTTVLPGDAASAILRNRATPERLAAVRARLKLDRPAPVRYVEWLGGIVRGDWGDSLIMNVPVRPLVLQRLRNTAVLAALALALAVPLGIGLGLLAALARNRWLDHTIRASILVAVSAPGFVTALALIVVFASWLHWLPSSSLIEPNANLWESVRFLILPTLTVALGLLAHITLMARSSMIEALRSDYVRTAILKGLPMRTVVLIHALPNALLPTMSVIALDVGYLMGGFVLVETIFAYPGLGALMVQAVGNRDVPLLQAVALLIAAFYALSNLAADLLYRVLNPRIRYS
ncbi:MAG: ABC transporter permease [Anaerolineae bacterium]|nr:ABC transporter permease [Anaerolineae bacterium]